MSSSVERNDFPQGHVHPIAKVATGIRGLDEVLLGGLPAGRTALVAGGPGTGKTMLGLEFLLRSAQAGEPGLFVTFEERGDAVRKNARAMGWDLEAMEEAGMLAIVPAELPVDLALSGEFSIDGLLAILAGHARALQASNIVVDAVDVLMRVFQDPLRRQSQLQALHRWLQDRAMTAVLTAKAAPDRQEQYPMLDYMADCVIRLDQQIDARVLTRRLRVVKYRGSAFLDSVHPYTITSGGLVLMPVSTVELVQQPLGPRMSAGSDNIDAMLGGGFRRASSILIAGSSGSGKTTFASIFARAACERQERVLFVSFEQSEEVLVSSMLSPGVDVRPVLDSGKLRVLTAMPESMGVEEHLLRILDALETFEPDHVVVDAISACDRMGTKEAGFAFLVRLLTWCKARGTTVLCTNQTTETTGAERISGFGISSLVDTLVLLQQIHAPVYLRRMLVVKSRGLKHSHTWHGFAITDAGLHFTEPARAGGASNGAEGGPS